MSKPELSSEDVLRWLDDNPEVLSRYLLENAPCQVVDAWLAGSSSRPCPNNSVNGGARKTSNASSTSDVNGGRPLSPILSESSARNSKEEEDVIGSVRRGSGIRGEVLGLNLMDMPALSDFDLMTIRETELFPPIARPEMFESPTESVSPPRRARFHSMCAEIESSPSRVLFSIDPSETSCDDGGGEIEDDAGPGTMSGEADGGDPPPSNAAKTLFGRHRTGRYAASASSRLGNHHHHHLYHNHQYSNHQGQHRFGNRYGGQHQFATTDPSSVASTPSGYCGAAAAAIRRRLSMKEMRKCTSLPPSTSHLLSLLMESRVRVPTCQSPDVTAKRRLKRRSQTHCFLELVRDISTELSVATLCSRVSINVGVLADAEPATVLLADSGTAAQSSSASSVSATIALVGADANKNNDPDMDPRRNRGSSLNDDAMSPTPASTTNIARFLVPAPQSALTASSYLLPSGGGGGRQYHDLLSSRRPKFAIPWGRGVLGKVAETGEKVVFKAIVGRLERSRSKKRSSTTDRSVGGTDDDVPETDAEASTSADLTESPYRLRRDPFGSSSNGGTGGAASTSATAGSYPSHNNASATTGMRDAANLRQSLKDGGTRLGTGEVCVAALPVRNPWGEVIAVAQTVKTDGLFQPEDLQLVETYLQFVGIALTNALVLEASKKEYERNKELLEVVHDVFEVQTSVDQLVTRMMQRAHRLLHCTRAAVFLLDESNQEASRAVDFSKVFHSKSKRPRTWQALHSEQNESRQHQSDGGPKLSHGSPSSPAGVDCDPAADELRCFAEQVALSGQVLNVSRRYQQFQLQQLQILQRQQSSSGIGTLAANTSENCSEAEDSKEKEMCRTPSVASSVGEMLFLAGESAKKSFSSRRPQSSIRIVDSTSANSKQREVDTSKGSADTGNHSNPPSPGSPSPSAVPGPPLSTEQHMLATSLSSNVIPLLPDSVSCLMAMPIRNARVEVIGVAVICNKVGDDCFDEHDERWFEAFCIFSGLGLNNACMYLQVTRAMARQTVAFEALAYHATSSLRDVELFMAREIPNIKEWNLDAVDFDDFSLNADEMVLATIAMFDDLNLSHRFCIDRTILYRWLLTVRRNYRDIPYHNWRHAFNVAQNMYAMLQNSLLRECFSDEEILALFLSCLCHDLDHRGTNNAFQAKSGSALAASYGTEHTMEHHHFNHAILILSSSDHNILSELPSESYSRIVSLIKHCILATDLTVYFKHRCEFQELASHIRDKRDMSKAEAVEHLRGSDGHRTLLQAQLMTACDLAACTKQWDIQRRVAYLVTTEFFDQGDKEMSELNLEPAAPMDRRRQHEFPFLQYKWIRDVCLPLYHAFGKLDDSLMEMRKRAADNMAHWRKEAEELHLLKSGEE